ncbi:aspartate carbamoyltransferase regulatory subunit [Candidatus Bathyarchaeota archaeon]|jgi:aspartate carbamoyltransferase regulatory subunit|nr:aspartate carbamoyltransferase regulatory subunit [Candidatus Bathyarchaeota archaeon]
MAVADELRVKKIREGTVIDHINAGTALSVLRILGLIEKGNYVVTIAINVQSKKLGRKDIVKVEERALNAEEADKIALIAPQATINIIRDYSVVAKQRTKLPQVIRGIVKCDNLSCISNSSEPIQPTFFVEREDPLRIRCYYCNRIMDKEDVLRQF